MDIPDAPRALPLICYEAIFPGDISSGDERPGWIVNLTNDGWFGIRPAPINLQQAQMRASKKACPRSRRQYRHFGRHRSIGRIVARLGLAIEGVFDANLPSALPATVYSRMDIPAAVMVAAALLLVFRRRFARRNA